MRDQLRIQRTCYSFEKWKEDTTFKLSRAIYGCIESALCWYNLYTIILKDEGFVINSYDRYVGNKVIKVNQYIISCYVDDNKIPHIDLKRADHVLDIIEGHLEKLEITRWKAHNFRGMEIRITEDKRYISL